MLSVSFELPNIEKSYDALAQSENFMVASWMPHKPVTIDRDWFFGPLKHGFNDLSVCRTYLAVFPLRETVSLQQMRDVINHEGLFDTPIKKGGIENDTDDPEQPGRFNLDVEVIDKLPKLHLPKSIIEAGSEIKGSNYREIMQTKKVQPTTPMSIKFLPSEEVYNRWLEQELGVFGFTTIDIPQTGPDFVQAINDRITIDPSLVIK